jgi:hypothetical protein
VKTAHPFYLNFRFVLLSAGVIVLAGNMLLATKIWKLWPLLVSMFFSFMDIYAALYAMVTEFIS